MPKARKTVIKIRVNDEEHARIKRRADAAGVEVAVFCRQSAIGSEAFQARREQDEAVALLHEIRADLRELCHEVASHSTTVSEELLGQGRLAVIEQAVLQFLSTKKNGSPS